MSSLSTNEVEIKRELSEKLYKVSKLTCSNKWQRSRARLFSRMHKQKIIIKDNEILIWETNEKRLGGGVEINNTIFFYHFRNHYITRGVSLIPANMDFKRNERENIKGLVQQFWDEEICNEVWECPNSKSPCLKKLSFRFVKEFQEKFKDNFLRMLEEFHANVWMVKGKNIYFIVLIPKNKIRQN